MTDTRREQIIDIVKREIIGPDPLDLPGYKQENGEEILTLANRPRERYLAGILYPQSSGNDFSEFEQTVDTIESEENEDNENISPLESKSTASVDEYLDDFEEVLNLSNALKPSAISITVAIMNGDRIFPSVKAGVYSEAIVKFPDRDGQTKAYLRQQISWDNNANSLDLPDAGINTISIDVKGKHSGLQFIITPRIRDPKEEYTIYTFSLVNSLVSDTGYPKEEECFFQASFSLRSAEGFNELPDKGRVVYDDDYHSGRLLYRSIKDFGIGHGCSAVWEETNSKVFEIRTEIFPAYETKPIIPANIDGVSLSMLKMSDPDSTDEVLDELSKLCSGYGMWIDELKQSVSEIDDQVTARRHIGDCEECLERMRIGVRLLTEEKRVMQAFQLMNKAMLMQQIHYGLPLRKWMVNANGKLMIDDDIISPQIDNWDTWYGDRERYGKWRAFQLAFILMNLRGMSDRFSSDRGLVDLIWFPTGGGKTEAYLGLSAFTIFVRRLIDRRDHGTAILMRYTLRLLTTQQYERAAAMICACETIRQEAPDLLGDSRISIGLWVGGDTTPNKMNDAVRKYERLLSEQNEENPFVMLKCPWCGAQMGSVQPDKQRRYLQGYKKNIGRYGKKSFIFQCSNKTCSFSQDDNPLPLTVIDEEIYDSPPTLLLGTVDKFAMLPYRPEAKSLFGIKEDGTRYSAPDLIIQDELHLISGPLGSMVGHYETLIHELCTDRRQGNPTLPKIVASTATISRAKEQCHALYACGPDNVKQFPPQGLEAGDSYFAREAPELAGRIYVGIFASGPRSPSTTMIRLYSALLYAAKALRVKDEVERDPYWTNVGYFNSIRELGQTATWIRQDISEYLPHIYKRRFENKKEKRRNIYREEELTSRIRSDQIPASLQSLGIRYPSTEPKPIDICLATNMISVGIDIPRLGLMTVAGQPKTTSEYIQATSRVGRSEEAPGLIFTFYNPSKPRDRSHYEHFQTYHSKMYSFVEPTSITPFSAPLRERALHAIIVGLTRFFENKNFNADPPNLPEESRTDMIRQVIQSRILLIDPEEMDDTLKQFDEIVEKWKIWRPGKFADFSNGDITPLMYAASTLPNPLWGGRGFKTLTSLRNVDASCEIAGLSAVYTRKDK